MNKNLIVNSVLAGAPIDVYDAQGKLDLFTTAGRWKEYCAWLMSHCEHCQAELSADLQGSVNAETKCPGCHKDLCPF